MGKRQTIDKDPLDKLPDNPVDLLLSDYQPPKPTEKEEPPLVDNPQRKVGYKFADEVYWLVKRMAHWERENPSDVAERLLRAGVEAAQEARGEPYPPHPDEDTGE